MAQKPGHILVVDDDPDVLKAADMLLKRHFKQVTTEQRPDNLPQHLQAQNWDVILLDMNFEPGANTGAEGLQWLGAILQAQPNVAVILMTAYGTVNTAVNAIKQGAMDFVLKPWQNERLLTTVSNALQLGESRSEVQRLKRRQKEMGGDSPAYSMVGDSPSLQTVRNMIQRVAATDASVLILGENGTGKEVVAREIFKHSTQKNEVFVSVDLGSVSENLFESELFGHKKGSFTGASSDRIGRFQAAHGGTLFLDEIGNLPMHLQGKLLTALEQRQVVPVGSNKPINIDVRLICATNKPLLQMVNEGTFREDLLYRINTVEIVVPPLRERGDDLAPLIEHFAAHYAKKYNTKPPTVSATTIKQCRDYAWPGNIRELRHAVERTLILDGSGELDAGVLLMKSGETAASDLKRISDEEELNLELVEKYTIQKALHKHTGNISHAAKELGITRTSLYRRMEKYDI